MSEPRQYRKKPVVIDAMELTRENVGEVEGFVNGKVREGAWPGPGRGITSGMKIRTLEGDMLAAWGDWIIRGVTGEFYPCKPHIFHETYEPVTVRDQEER